MMTNKNDCFTFDNPRVQYFSFPPDIIYCLRKHPKSSSGILKLYQTCKYFYYKQKVAFFYEIYYYQGYRKDYDTPVLKFKNSAVLIANKLTISRTFPSIPDSTNCYVITTLILQNIKLKYDEFQALVLPNANIKTFIFKNSTFTCADNTPVSIDAIFEKLPNIENFEYGSYNDTYSLEALKNLNAVKLKKKFKKFKIEIFEIADSFDPLLLCKFIGNNIRRPCSIHILTHFTDQIKGKSLKEGIKEIWNSLEGFDTESSFALSGTICYF